MSAASLLLTPHGEFNFIFKRDSGLELRIIIYRAATSTARFQITVRCGQGADAEAAALVAASQAYSARSTRPLPRALLH